VEKDLADVAKISPALSDVFRQLLIDQMQQSQLRFTRVFNRVHTRDPTQEELREAFTQAGELLATLKEGDLKEVIRDCALAAGIQRFAE
jgi:hypothetical protein